MFRGDAEGGGSMGMNYVSQPDPSMTPKEVEEFLLLYALVRNAKPSRNAERLSKKR
jgi:hypothetical protein